MRGRTQEGEGSWEWERGVGVLSEMREKKREQKWGTVHIILF